MKLDVLGMNEVKLDDNIIVQITKQMILQHHQQNLDYNQDEHG